MADLIDRAAVAEKFEAEIRLAKQYMPTAVPILRAVSDAIAAIEPAEAGGVPAWLSNCVTCGRIVDTREKDEGGDGHGCEYPEGWTCSSGCAEKLHPDPDWMAAEAGGVEATNLQKVQNAPFDDREAFLEWLDSLPKEPNDTLKAAYAAYKAAVRPAPVDALVKAAEAVAEDACSYICPSTGKAGEPISHDPRCVALRAALRKDHEQRE